MNTARSLEPGVLAWRVGATSWLWSRGPARAVVLLAVLLLVSVAVSVAAGSRWLTPADLGHLLRGDASRSMALLVWEFRLPRIAVAALAGASLGLAGSLLQTLMHNRLASPDLMGVSDGATVAVMVGLLASADGMFGPWWIGVAGAVGATVLLLALAGGIGPRGQRVLVVGLAVAALLRAVTELALSRESLQHAAALYSWSIGSLTGRGLAAAWPLAVGMVVLWPWALVLSRRLSVLRLDADVASSLGLSVRRTQWQVLAIATAAAGLSVGVCGPVAFVALAAPVAADRLAGRGHVTLTGAALAGATLVVVADTLGRVLLPSGELPVGVVCNLLGGPFLLWMLTRKEMR